MKGYAHISFPDGGLIVPSETPYERELLFEHVEASTKRHKCVRLEVDRGQWTISLTNGLRQLCIACGRSMAGPTYRFDKRILCGLCARHALQ